MNDTLLIVGCTRRKTAVAHPVPAFLLYQGGLMPNLRQRLGTHDTTRWDKVLFLSGRHGLIHATTSLPPYDQPLTTATADALRPVVAQQFNEHCRRDGVPTHMLLICESDYAALFVDAIDAPRSRLSWISDIRGGWPRVAAVLDSWGWI